MDGGTLALTDLDFTLQDAICGLVAKGVPPVEAAVRVGVTRRGLDAMLRSDPDFKERYETAIELMIAGVHRTVHDAARDGDMRAVELFYRQWAPHLAAQTTNSRAGENAPRTTVNVTLVAVREMLMSDKAPELLGLLHQLPEVIEASASEDND